MSDQQLVEQRRRSLLAVFLVAAAMVLLALAFDALDKQVASAVGVQGVEWMPYGILFLAAFIVAGLCLVLAYCLFRQNIRTRRAIAARMKFRLPH